jgi:hypothetical protein
MPQLHDLKVTVDAELYGGKGIHLHPVISIGSHGGETFITFIRWDDDDGEDGNQHAVVVSTASRFFQGLA